MKGVKQAVGRQRLETYSEVEGMDILFAGTKRIRVEVSDSEKDKDDKSPEKKKTRGNRGGPIRRRNSLPEVSSVAEVNREGMRMRRRNQASMI